MIFWYSGILLTGNLQEAAEYHPADPVIFSIPISIYISSRSRYFEGYFRHYPGTAPLGGHLGYTLRGSLVKEYEEAAYSLKPGDISEPVKTSFGYHLIRLLERQGEKILTQHILRTVGFSEKDKKNSYSIVNDIILKIDNDSLLFDSLANIFSNKYKNYSGKYKNYSPSDIPSDVLLSLKQLNLFDVSSPIETNNGYALIFYYNHRELVDPNLINSWDLIFRLSILTCASGI